MSADSDKPWYAYEPVIHSFVTDVLPDGHPRAYEIIECDKCKTMVHCCNNECMDVWLEWGPHVLCIECATPVLNNCLSSGSDFLAAIAGKTTDEYLDSLP